jgi:hypothetical protein
LQLSLSLLSLFRPQRIPGFSTHLRSYYLRDRHWKHLLHPQCSNRYYYQGATEGMRPSCVTPDLFFLFFVVFSRFISLPLIVSLFYHCPFFLFSSLLFSILLSVSLAFLIYYFVLLINLIALNHHVHHNSFPSSFLSLFFSTLLSQS